MCRHKALWRDILSPAPPRPAPPRPNLPRPASPCPAQVNCVRMRRHMTSKTFKGSVFLEFDTVETMEKVWSRGRGGY